MITALKRSYGNSIEMQIGLPWPEIKSTYDEIMQILVAQVEVEGFRKGKVPLEIAQKNISKTKVYEEVLKKMIPDVYSRAVSENHLHPIISPKVEVLEAEENKEWKIKISTAEKPIITLGNYRKGIDDLIASKKKQIWTPQMGKEKPKENEPTIAELLDVIAKEIKVEIAPVIVEHEVNRLLTDLIDQTQKLGMTVEQYLQAKNLTSESIRKNYQEEATKTLSLEFALEEIANAENVIVENTEIDQVISQAKTPQEKETLEKQKYYLGSLIRRQKTIQKLLKPTIIKP